MTPKQRIAVVTAIASALAAPLEGLRRVAYYDPPGILTVCEGHTGRDVVKGRVYSLAECKKFMADDMLIAVEAVDQCAPGLPENILAAFADAVYNMGPTIACSTKQSAAARLLKAGKLADACNQLSRWNKTHIAGVAVSLPGLTSRRAIERALCLKGLT